MKFWMGGYAYTKDLTYYLQVDFTQGSSSRLLEWAYMNYKIIDEVQIRAGQEKVAFGRQWITSSGSQQFVDRSPTSDFFRPGYDIGVKLNGKVAKGLFYYDLGGYGGLGQSTVRATNDNAFLARITFNPLGDMPYGEADVDQTAKPLFSVGANYFYDRLQFTRDATATLSTVETNNLNFTSNGFLTNSAAFTKFPRSEKLDVMLYGVDAAFKWMGLYATAEYLLGQAEGDSSGALLRAHGYFVQAGYCILPKRFELAARYSYIDPDRTRANDLRSEVAGALSYYFNKHNLKIQGDIANIHNQATGRSDEMQYRLQAQIIF
jgi:phosphate-selective porin